MMKRTVRLIMICETKSYSLSTAELLKDKAIQFFKSGNWEAALNAFTAAIDLNSNFHT